MTKKAIFRLALFLAVIGIASLFDSYFEKNPAKFDSIEKKSEEKTAEHNTVYLISQSNSFGAKTSVQKTVTRKLQLKSHDKFIRQYHQLRNYQVLKAEVQLQTTPLISTYPYLAFKNYFFSDPDDAPPAA